MQTIHFIITAVVVNITTLQHPANAVSRHFLIDSAKRNLLIAYYLIKGDFAYV